MNNWIAKLDQIYADRGYDSDPKYSEFSVDYLVRSQNVEFHYLQFLNQFNNTLPIENCKILDYGCGNGSWIGRILSWGAYDSNVWGCDVRDGAIKIAKKKFTAPKFVNITTQELPKAYFDIAMLNLVISSLINPSDRSDVARNVSAALKSGGVILFYDFCINNPLNPNVRNITIVELMQYFYDFDVLILKKTSMMPFLSRMLAKISPRLCAYSEDNLPYLKTHFVCLLKKKDHHHD